MATTWYVIINRDAQILAVYGSALLDMARAQLAKMPPFGVALTRTVSSTRPHVGDYLGTKIREDI